MVYLCTGIKNRFTYTDKRSGNTVSAIIFYGTRKPIQRDGEFTGYVAEDKFIGERTFAACPKDNATCGFEVNKYYDFKYESDGATTWISKVEQVEGF